MMGAKLEAPHMVTGSCPQLEIASEKSRYINKVVLMPNSGRSST